MEILNLIDIVLFFVIIAYFLLGWRLRGIYLLVIPIAFFVGIFIANLSYLATAKILTGLIKTQPNRNLMAYTLMFVISSGVVIFAGMTLARFFDVFKIDILDRILGAVLFTLIMVIPTYFVFEFLQKLPLSMHLKSNIETSLILTVIKNYVNVILKMTLFKHISKMAIG